MSKYTEHTTDSGIEYILRDNGNDTVSWIPKDEANSDYQSYLRWLNGEDENGTISQKNELETI